MKAIRREEDAPEAGYVRLLYTLSADLSVPRSVFAGGEMSVSDLPSRGLRFYCAISASHLR